MYAVPEMKPYRCVNCAAPSAALYKRYGPEVLKLNKCDSCNGVVDKYVEYDAVIVLIDVVLMSREAQRHVLYNTHFQSYWKLLVIFLMLETYGVWRSDSLFNLVVYAVCGIQTNSTINSTVNLISRHLPPNFTTPESFVNSCIWWDNEERGDDNDLFIWEKDFYIHFLGTFSGYVSFILAVHSSMKMRQMTRDNAPIESVFKGIALANVSILFTLPMLVWGNAETSPETRIIHYALVFAYSFVVFLNIFTVLYECDASRTLFMLCLSYGMKYFTSFHITPVVEEYLPFLNKT